MKDQINKIVGGIVIFSAKFSIIVLLCIMISTAVVESEREDMFFQVMKYFEVAYEVKVDELYMQFGIVEEGEIDQERQDSITNI